MSCLVSCRDELSSPFRPNAVDLRATLQTREGHVAAPAGGDRFGAYGAIDDSADAAWWQRRYANGLGTTDRMDDVELSEASDSEHDEEDDGVPAPVSGGAVKVAVSIPLGASPSRTGAHSPRPPSASQPLRRPPSSRLVSYVTGRTDSDNNE